MKVEKVEKTDEQNEVVSIMPVELSLSIHPEQARLLAGLSELVERAQLELQHKLREYKIGVSAVTLGQIPKDYNLVSIDTDNNTLLFKHVSKRD